MNSIDLAGIGMTSQRTRERLINRLIEQGILDQRVLDVIRMTPRHIFLDEALAHRAYEDTALPIGFSQTLSQPYIVARMTEILLSAGPLKKVLEVGTGSGYQATILAQLVDEVYTVERIEPLLKKAKERLESCGLAISQLNYPMVVLAGKSMRYMTALLRLRRLNPFLEGYLSNLLRMACWSYLWALEIPKIYVSSDDLVVRLSLIKRLLRR